MKKYILIALVAISATACNNNSAVTSEQTEQHPRDSIDAAQHITDSMAVEAKMREDMIVEDSSVSADTTKK